MANSNSNRSAISSVSYKLVHPLVQGNEVIDELHIRPPQLKHLKHLDGAKGDMERMCRLIEKLCDIRPGLIDEIQLVDLNEIGKIIENFSKPSQAI